MDIYRPSEKETYEFVQLIVNNLKRVINEEISNNINYSQNHTCDLFLKNYIPNIDLFNAVINNISMGLNSLVYGEHGTGKTSFAVYLYRNIKQLSDGVNCFLYSTDFSIDNNFSIKEAMMNWSENLSHQKLDAMATVIEEWKRFKYFHYQQTNPTIIIIDGYDKNREIRDSNVFMVPTKGIVYIVLSSTSLPKWEMRFQITPQKITELSTDEAKLLINKILNYNKKNIPAYVFDAILKFRKKEEEGTYNPLDIVVLLSYILSLDKDDFDKITNTLNHSEEKALYEHIVSIVKEMPHEDVSRSNYILQKMKLLFNYEQFYPLLYISYSLYGLSESDFLSLMPNYDAISFYLIRNYLKPYLPTYRSDGRWHIYNTEIGDSIKGITSNESKFYYNLSKLESITQNEKFYYAIYGYNDQLTYELYSSVDESNGLLDYSRNGILLSYFEDVNNIIWFLSILEDGNPVKNEIIISNLLFSFYTHFSRQNPNVNSLKFLFLLFSCIESGKIPLDGKTNYYYLGMISESIGRHILNRNIDKSVKKIGTNHLKKAIHYYNLYGGADSAM